MCEHYCEHSSRHTVKLGLLESMHSCMHACMHAWQSACTRSRLILRCRHSPCPRPCPSTCAACCHTHPTPSRSASGCGSPGGTWTEHHGPQAAQSHTPAAGPGRHMVGVQTSATMQQVECCLPHACVLMRCWCPACMLLLHACVLMRCWCPACMLLLHACVLMRCWCVHSAPAGLHCMPCSWAGGDSIWCLTAHWLCSMHSRGYLCHEVAAHLYGIEDVQVVVGVRQEVEQHVGGEIEAALAAHVA
jgi:hypothetical protein